MAKKKTKKATSKKEAKTIIKTDDLPNVSFSGALRLIIKSGKKTSG